MSGDAWVWVAYPYDQWAWSEMNGWYNPEDDPASPTETVLLDEIKRLQGLLADHGYHGPDCKFGNCWCDESKEARREQ